MSGWQRNVSSGSNQFTVTKMGGITPLVTGSFTLEAQNYTLNIIGDTSAASLLLVTLPAPISPGSGNVFLGFLHVAYNVPAVG